LPEQLSGDPIRLRQILLNLVANAIQFTDSGHVLISLEMLEHQGDQAKLRFSVEDTGIGISEEAIPLIRDPHVQISDSHRSRTSGVGLGLTICDQLVRLMNGELKVDSQPGHGSTFWVELTLPLAESRHSTRRAENSALQGKRILVVDAYPLSRKITLELLTRTEASFYAVSNAREALHTLAESRDTGDHYDLIIVDGFLPDMDADLLCQRLRDTASGDQLQILALSSNPQRGDGEHFRQAGATGFLSKALRETYLAPVLQRMLANQAVGQQQFVTRFTVHSPTPASSDQGYKVFDGLPVMLVEDNPVNRRLTQRLLEKLGCKVTLAEDGEEALAHFDPDAFRVIFMDCMLPGIDGFDTTREWRRLEKQAGATETPIIALTASAMAEDEEQCLIAGMTGFIAKPVSRSTLQGVLEQHAPDYHQG